MSNKLRSFRRKQQREFNYAQYSQHKTLENYKKRYESVMERFKQCWVKAVEDNVPERYHKIAKLFPPKWYFNVVKKFLDFFYSEKRVEKVSAIARKRSWGKFRTDLEMNMWMGIGNFFFVILLKWAMWINRRIHTFGISQKITEVKKGTLKLTIKKWFKTIEELEVTI